MDLRRRTLLRSAALATGVGLAGCADDGADDDGGDGDVGGADGGSGGGGDDAGHGSEDSGSQVVVREATLADSTVHTGDVAEVTAVVASEGAASGTVDLALRADGEVVATASPTLEAGAETTVRFEAGFETPGTRELRVGGAAGADVEDATVGDLVVRTPPRDAARSVGAHYYPWYGAPAHSWRDGRWSLESPSTPVLGDYDSTDPDVIERHVDWCHRAGVDWLNVSWWGPDSHEDERLRDDLLAHHRADELSWSILYETVGRFDGGAIDLDDPSNRERLREDLAYLAETYFDREVYRRIDGRPVLYVWVADSFRGDVAGAYESAVDAAGVRPYLIADLPVGSTIDVHPIASVADAVTTYALYSAGADDVEAAFERHARAAHEAWYLAAEYADVDVLPAAQPGFDDTELTHDPRDNEPVPPSPERYERVAELARRYADGPVLVTSFNEWYEDTQIEPSEEHGEAYLEVTADALATAEREPPSVDGATLALAFEETVPETELEPDVTEPRDLAMLVHRLEVRDAQGTSVVEVDVGAETDARFLLGAYAPEANEDRTWRWLGGDGTAVVQLPALPERGTLELEGRAATYQSVTLRVDGDAVGTGSVDDEHGTYTVSFG